MCGVIMSPYDNYIPPAPSPLWEQCKCGPCPIHSSAVWTTPNIPSDIPHKPKHRKPGPAQ